MADPKIIQFPLGLTENLQYHYTKVEVSSGEILTLNSAPTILVVAPGAGKISIPITALVKFHYGTAPYDGTNDTPDLKLQGDANPTMRFNGILSQVIDFRMFGIIENAAAHDHTENAAIILTEDVDPTLGDGTLTVYLWYINLEL